MKYGTKYVIIAGATAGLTFVVLTNLIWRVVVATVIVEAEAIAKAASSTDNKEDQE